MSDYRFYYLDADGHIERAVDMVFHDDDAAITHAKIIGTEHGIEIWDGKRKVRDVLP